LTTQQRRGPLYGGDIDAMTDVMDDVIGRVDWVALDDCMLEASGLRFLADALHTAEAGSVAERLACWTRAQKGPGSNRSRDAVLGKLFTPVMPLFTKQQNW